jgi:hypothetical protein
MSLPAGDVALLNFNVTTEESAKGWYTLVLSLDYEHQMDVKVSNGSLSSLYRPATFNQKISILVQGPDRSLKVESVLSDLYPGSNGTILAIIKNNGFQDFNNCSAKLIAKSPFRSTTDRYYLGNIKVGQIKVAILSAYFDEKAVVRVYRLACEITYDNQTVTLSLPVILKKSPGFISTKLISSIVPIVIVLAAAIILLQRRPIRRPRKRKKWP